MSFRLYPATSGPSSSSGDATSYTMGLLFKVTLISYSLFGYWWWVADSAQQPGPFEFALWEVTGSLVGSSASYIANSSVTSGTLSLGWNYTALGTSLPLAANQEYLAVIAVNASGGHTASYSATGGFWNGGAGAGGITNGPLTAYSSFDGTAPDPNGNPQMSFDSGGTDPTVNLPSTYFNAGNYWLDVLVDIPQPPPPPVAYSMRMFP